MDLFKFFKKKDTKDYSNNLECYYPCPKCGKKSLGFMTSLDFINSTPKHLQYDSTIICNYCSYKLVTSELQAREYNKQNYAKISFYELNRRRWNQQYKKTQESV